VIKKIAVAFIAVASVAIADVHTDVVSFEKGLNLLSRAELTPSGYMVGYSFNFVPRPDGAIKKRPGFVTNTAINSLTPHEGGPAIFDGDKLFVISNGQAQWVNQVLGTAIRDSAVDANYMASATAIMFEDAVYFAVPKNTTASVAGYPANVWRYDMTIGAWSRWIGGVTSETDSMKIKFWGKYKNSTTRRDYLYFGGYIATQGVRMFDPDSTVDYYGSTPSRHGFIAQAITPAFGLGTWNKYMRFEMPIENSDSIRVLLTYTTKLATNKPRTSTELVAAFGPGTGDTTSVGQVHVKSIDLKQREGYTAQITIWASGTGRCIIHPCRLIYERNPL